MDLPLAQALHTEGINVRYTGVVLAHIPKDDQEVNVVTRVRCPFLSPVNSADALYVDDISLSQMWLLLNILVRVMKNDIRVLMKKTLKWITTSVHSAPFREVIAKYLNLVFVCDRTSAAVPGWTAKTERHWNKHIKGKMESAFECRSPYVDSGFNLRSCIMSWSDPNFNKFEFVLGKLNKHLGLQFSTFACSKLERGIPLGMTDIEGLEERVKYMNIVSDSMGSYLQCQGIKSTMQADLEQAACYFDSAEEQYKKSLL